MTQSSRSLLARARVLLLALPLFALGSSVQIACGGQILTTGTVSSDTYGYGGGGYYEPYGGYGYGDPYGTYGCGYDVYGYYNCYGSYGYGGYGYGYGGGGYGGYGYGGYGYGGYP